MASPACLVLLLCSIYDTKPIHFILIFCNTIKCVQKSRQFYNPDTKMVCNTQFLRLNVNDSYNYNMNSVDLSDQITNVYQVDYWMHKYKWWWTLLFWGHGVVLANAYIIYKKLFEEGKVKPMSHYEFQRMTCLSKFDPKRFDSCDHLVSADQRQGIRKSMSIHLLLLFQHRGRYKRNNKIGRGSWT